MKNNDFFSELRLGHFGNQKGLFFRIPRCFFRRRLLQIFRNRFPRLLV
jgi:hypothetical protein